MRKVSVLFLCLFLGVVCFTTSSCKFDDDPTYEVYQFRMSPLNFYKSFGVTVSEGYYRNISLTTAEYNSIADQLGSSYKYEMDKTEMLEWCEDHGFGDKEASDVISWLIDKNHGLIASGSSYSIYCLVK